MIRAVTRIRKAIVFLGGALIGWTFSANSVPPTDQASRQHVLDTNSPRSLAAEKNQLQITALSTEKVDGSTSASDGTDGLLSGEEVAALPKGVLRKHVNARIEKLFEKYVNEPPIPSEPAAYEILHKRVANRTRELLGHELLGTFRYETPKGHVVVEILKEPIKPSSEPWLQGRHRQKCFHFDLTFKLLDEPNGEVIRKHREYHYSCVILRERDGEIVTTAMISPNETPYFGHFFSYSIPESDLVSDVQVIPDHQEHKPISGKIVWIVRDDTKGDEE